MPMFITLFQNQKFNFSSQSKTKTTTNHFISFQEESSKVEQQCAKQSITHFRIPTLLSTYRRQGPAWKRVAVVVSSLVFWATIHSNKGNKKRPSTKTAKTAAAVERSSSQNTINASVSLPSIATRIASGRIGKLTKPTTKLWWKLILTKRSYSMLEI